MLPPMWPRPTNPMLGEVAVAMSALPFDRGDVVVVQVEVRGYEDRIDLVGAAESNDGSVDGRVAQRPCDRDHPRGGVVALRDVAEALDELEVARELGLLEPLASPAPVVVRQGFDSLARHRSGKQSG